MQSRCRQVTARAGMLGLSLACAAGIAPAVSEAPAMQPIVLELYTSEGCSSCPPAEVQAARLATRTDLLVLAYHVDYWDDLGWRDRFSLVAATARQRQWAQANDSPQVFTPQLIVDGRQSLLGSDGAALASALLTARERHAANVPRPFTATIAGGHLRIDAPDTPLASTLDLYAISFLPQATTPIPRGENAGRTINEVNVVRSVSRLAAVTRGGAHLLIDCSAFPADASRLALLLQNPGTGAVNAALTLKLR